MSEEKNAEMPKANAQKRGGFTWVIILMIVFGAAVPFILPTLVLLAGMLPTIVALFTEDEHNHSSAAAIGAMNAAGIVPFVIELWHKGQTIDNAFALISDPTTWLVMLGAAALGQLIVFAVPQAIASISVSHAEARIALLKKNLETLQAMWGPDVATTKPLERVARGE